MEPGKTVYVTNREGFRSWLEKNAGEAREIWLVVSGESAGAEPLTGEEALLEALCFGWAEGRSTAIDAHKRVQEFIPRRPDQPWTETDLERARELAAAGRMTRAGLGALPEGSIAKGTKGTKEG